MDYNIMGNVNDKAEKFLIDSGYDNLVIAEDKKNKKYIYVSDAMNEFLKDENKREAKEFIEFLSKRYP